MKIKTQDFYLMVGFSTSTFTENRTVFATFGVGRIISTANGNGILTFLGGLAGVARTGSQFGCRLELINQSIN